MLHVVVFLDVDFEFFSISSMLAISAEVWILC